MSKLVIFFLIVPLLVEQLGRKFEVRIEKGWTLIYASLLLSSYVALHFLNLNRVLVDESMPEFIEPIFMLLPILIIFSAKLRATKPSLAITAVFVVVLVISLSVFSLPELRNPIENLVFKMSFQFQTYPINQDRTLNQLEIDSISVVLPRVFSIAREPTLGSEFMVLKENDRVVAEVVFLGHSVGKKSLSRLLIDLKQKYRPNKLEYEVLKQGYSFALSNFSNPKTLSPLPLHHVFGIQNLTGSNGFLVVSWCEMSTTDICDKAVHEIMNGIRWQSFMLPKSVGRGPTISRWML